MLATAWVSNNGVVRVTGDASAVGTAFDASRVGERDWVLPVRERDRGAFATFINDLTITSWPMRMRWPRTSTRPRSRYANGGFQQVIGSNATASVDNNGIINVRADAHAVNTATGTGFGTILGVPEGAGAYASANATGIGQQVTATGDDRRCHRPQRRRSQCRRDCACDRRGRCWRGCLCDRHLSGSRAETTARSR